MPTALEKISSRPGFTPIMLALVLLLGFSLRLYGIQWGLPDASHPLHSYHPDEAFFLFAAERLATGEIIPKHFMYGGTVFFSILNTFSHVAVFFQDTLAGENLLADTILLGRYVLVGVALITIILTYHAGRLLFDRPVGVLAALFLAVAPAHVIFSQALRPDAIATLVTLSIVYLSARIFHSKPNNLRYCAYTGLVLGAALSLRFPLIVFAGVPLVALLLGSDETSIVKRLQSVFDRRLAAMVLGVPAAYLLTSPQTFMYPEIFIAGLKVQWRYQSNPFFDAVEMGPGIYQYGWLMLHQALGYGLYAIAALGFIYALFKRTAPDRLLLAAIIPYFLLISFTSWVVVRYALPLLPLLVILAARAMHVILTMRRFQVAGSAVVALIIGWTLLADAAYLRLEAGKNVRELAAEWIEQNVPRGSSVATVRTYVEDKFFNPVLPPHYIYHAFLLYELSDSTPLIWTRKYDYLVLHENFYKNMERLGPRHPSPHIQAFHESLKNSRYRLIKEFKQPATLFGIDFSDSFSSNDYTIVNPGIRVYQY